MQLTSDTLLEEKAKKIKARDEVCFVAYQQMYHTAENWQSGHLDNQNIGLKVSIIQYHKGSKFRGLNFCGLRGRNKFVGLYF